MPKARIFCDMTIDLFSMKDRDTVFEFYIASFSRNRDDPHQWVKYGQERQGFALGLAPKLFGVEDKPNRKPHENIFVSPVLYGNDAVRRFGLPAIEGAVRVVAETVDRKAKAMTDINKGMPFFREMAEKLLACELILYCLFAKHMDWAPEQEVREIIFGEGPSLAPYVSTRSRGAETVPFIKSDMPIEQPGCIAEIVVGPSAPFGAEDFICSLLEPFHRDPRSVIRRSSL